MVGFRIYFTNFVDSNRALVVCVHPGMFNNDW